MSSKCFLEAEILWLVLSVRIFCQLMEQLQPKTGNILVIFCDFSLFLLILFLPNVSKNLTMIQDHINCMHNNNEGGWVLFGSMLCQLMKQLRPKTKNPLPFFVVEFSFPCCSGTYIFFKYKNIKNVM